MEAHPEVLPENTKLLFPALLKATLIGPFYLAGGTGLALQIGHRISGDLDFFSLDGFDESLLIQKLSRAGEFRLEKKSPETVLGIMNDVKVSFLGYSYPILFPFQEAYGVQLADLRDIACIKVDAVASRGTKRDFVDLYFIMKTVLALPDLLRLFEKKYASLRYNMVHVKKSLVYFGDAEGDPMPRMLQTIVWADVKDFLEREVMKVAD